MNLFADHFKMSINYESLENKKKGEFECVRADCARSGQGPFQGTKPGSTCRYCSSSRLLALFAAGPTDIVSVLVYWSCQLLRLLPNDTWKARGRKGQCLVTNPVPEETTE